MPESRAAEWLISLFTTRDAATSIVGDLVEEARRFGRLWFWWHAFGAAGRLCVREIAREPVRFLAVCAFGIFSYEHALLIADPTWISSWDWVLRTILFGRIVAPFFLGLLIALLAGRSAMTGCLAVALIRCSLTITQWSGKTVLWLLLKAVLPALPILAAGAYVHRKRSIHGL